MGRTVPSFRHALYQEQSTWRQFRLALDRKECKIFDEMFTISRLYISASMMSCKPIRLHPILLSIIFHHFKQISRLGGMNV
ncbi:hypothetical protein [Nitrosopumilus sp.]|uniref:hypothetical protein n=1 Tax=Nitrosopumilus sp. TaxID=2024843 RepID=UPI003B59A134